MRKKKPTVTTWTGSNNVQRALNYCKISDTFQPVNRAFCCAFFLLLVSVQRKLWIIFCFIAFPLSTIRKPCIRNDFFLSKKPRYTKNCGWFTCNFLHLLILPLLTACINWNRKRERAREIKVNEKKRKWNKIIMGVLFLSMSASNASHLPTVVWFHD